MNGTMITTGLRRAVAKQRAAQTFGDDVTRCSISFNCSPGSPEAASPSATKDYNKKGGKHERLQ